MSEKKILVGQVIAAHGIKGEVKLKSFTDNPLDVGSYGAVQDESGARRFTLKALSAQKTVVVVRIRGVASRNDAEALAKEKLKLYVPRAQLPPAGKGRYYFADLVGLVATDAASGITATVKGVYNFGGGDMLELQPEKGPLFYLPLKEPFAGDINLKKATLSIRIPEGWLETESKQKAEKRPRDSMPSAHTKRRTRKPQKDK